MSICVEQNRNHKTGSNYRPGHYLKAISIANVFQYISIRIKPPTSSKDFSLMENLLRSTILGNSVDCEGIVSIGWLLNSRVDLIQFRREYLRNTVIYTYLWVYLSVLKRASQESINWTNVSYLLWDHHSYFL